MSKLYRQLNDVKVPYEKMTLTESEHHQLTQLAKRHAHKTQGRRRKTWMAGVVAAAVLLGVGVTYPHLGQARLEAVREDIVTSFARVFNVDAASQHQVTTLRQPVEVGEEALRIDDVIMENNLIMMSIVGPSFDEDLAGSHQNLMYLEIEGKRYKVMGSSSQTKPIENVEGQVVNGVTFMLDKLLPERIDQMTLYFSAEQNSQLVTAVELKLPQTMLTTSTRMAADQAIPKAEGYVLKALNLSDAGQHALLEVPSNQKETLWQLVAKAGDGREAVFYTSGHFGDWVNLSYDAQNSQLSREELITQAKSLSYQLYEVKGEQGGIDRLPLGASFKLA